MDNRLENYSKLLGDSNELLIVKGQIKNIEHVNKGNDVYYLADLKVPKINSSEIYNTYFNMYHICFSSDYVKVAKINDEYMKQLKDNEVILNLTINSTIFKKPAENNQFFKYNRINFFVIDCIKTKDVEKVTSLKKVQIL